MKFIQKLKSYNTYELLLISSLVLILIKGLTYLLIGIIYPLLISLALLGPFIYCYLKRQCNISRTIKYWSVLVTCYGIVRILLHVIISINSDGVPSGAYYQFTWWLSLIHI